MIFLRIPKSPKFCQNWIVFFKFCKCSGCKCIYWHPLFFIRMCLPFVFLSYTLYFVHILSCYSIFLLINLSSNELRCRQSLKTLVLEWKRKSMISNKNYSLQSTVPGVMSYPISSNEWYKYSQSKWRWEIQVGVVSIMVPD